MHGMRDWQTALHTLGSVPLAADPRLTQGPLTKDHIWSLTTQHIQPQALTLISNVGMQAQAYQIFPIFVEDDNPLHQPGEFAASPVIHHLATNYLTLSFAHQQSVRSTLTCWVPECQTAAGQYTFTNLSKTPQTFHFRLAAILKPLRDGQPMQAITHEGRTLLGGTAGQLTPLLFLSGGAGGGRGPYANLSLKVELPPKGSKTIRWVTSAAGSKADSYQLIQDIHSRHWPSEFAKIENMLEGQLQIHTGDPMWDLTFALSQKIAFGSIAGTGSERDQFTFRDGRLNPEGHFPSAMNGAQPPLLTPLQSLYAADALGPTTPGIMESLLAPFLAAQKDDGFIPFRSHPKEDQDLLASPYLVSLAWKIYQNNRDLSSLGEVFPDLLAYLKNWFQGGNDRDSDGLPEWSRVRQTEGTAHPTHPSQGKWYLNPKIDTLESPALCALLHHEIHLLENMAEEIQQQGQIAPLLARQEPLVAAIRGSWDEGSNLFQRWDRDSHHTSGEALLTENNGPGLIILKKKLEPPARLVIHLQSSQPLSPKTRVFLHGEGREEEHWVESFSSHDFHWVQNHGRATSKHIYSFVEYVVPYGIDRGVTLGVHRANYLSDDIMLLLPLRSPAPSDDQVKALIADWIQDEDRLGSEYGLQSKPGSGAPISIVWNYLICDGLLKRDQRQLAASLMTRIMKLIIKNLASSRSFFAEYHGVTAAGMGSGYEITGMAPLGLFLRILGVRIEHQREVVVEGKNPFPWPVSIRYRGLDVHRGREETTITFPTGQRTTIADAAHKVVRLKGSSSANLST